MKILLIVFHSLTGGTRQMAEAAVKGAATEGDVTIRLLPAVQAQPSDVMTADGYIFGTPENLAAFAGLILIVCTHAQTPEAILAPKVISQDDLRRCEEPGAAFAAGMAMGIY